MKSNTHVICKKGTLEGVCEKSMLPSAIAKLKPEYEAVDTYDYLCRLNRLTKAKDLHAYCNELSEKGVFESVECRITTIGVKYLSISEVESVLARGEQIVLQVVIYLGKATQIERDHESGKIRDRFGLNLWPELESIRFYSR